MLKINEISFESDWNNLIAQSTTATFFQTKEWFQIWNEHFGGNNAKIFGVFDGSELIGIAPFLIQDQILHLLGSSPVLGKELVSDFGDIIALSGREKEVWDAVLKNFQFYRKNLMSEFIGQAIFNFQFIRDDSPSFRILKELGGKAEEIDVAPYIDLPKEWDRYLDVLDRHDRHELKRKIRRLEREGAYKICTQGGEQDIDNFFRLMSFSKEQKRDFLSPKMRSFFTDIFTTFFSKKMISLCFLKLNGKNIAATLAFEYNNEILLYNSGFDPSFYKLAPGFLLIAFIIKHAIEQGRERFDFLRGNERYKFDLGGKIRKLYKITFD